jgi:arylsulfatase A-like enzyme
VTTAQRHPRARPSVEAPARRVIIAVLDGLRADAIAEIPLLQLRALMARGAWTTSARTIGPSVTAAAMGSLLTGVPPQTHGLQSDRFSVPRPNGPVHPLPAQVRAAGLPASGFVRQVPWMLKSVAHGLARQLGFTRAVFGGRCAQEILAGAAQTIAEQHEGLIVLHWPDADIAGHAHGWMSLEYRAAALRLDAALGELIERAGVHDDDRTCLIALADHGGGGAQPFGHDSDHPIDRTIPIAVAGAGVPPGPLPVGTSLLDVPATALSALGLPLPSSYVGRALVGAPTFASLVA